MPPGLNTYNFPYFSRVLAQYPITYTSVSGSGTPPCIQCPTNIGAWFLPLEIEGGHISGYTTISTVPCVCNPGYVGVIDTTAGINTCTKCVTGSTTVILLYYLPLEAPGQSQCTCMPGYYSIDGYAHNNECTPCPYGSIGSAFHGYSAAKCDVCLIGYYSADGSPTAAGGCQICATGTSNTALGSNSCQVCAIDYYSPSGSAPFLPCVGSSTGELTGQTACSYPLASNIPTLSPAASPTPTIGATHRPTHPTSSPTMSPSLPAAYPIGTNSTTGKLPCTPCSKGSTNMNYGSTVCDACLFIMVSIKVDHLVNPAPLVRYLVTTQQSAYTVLVILLVSPRTLLQTLQVSL